MASELRSLLPEPIAVLGYGTEGQSTLALLLECGFTRTSLSVLDQKEQELPEGVAGVFGPGHLAELGRFHTIIRSAGVRPLKPELVEFVTHGGVLTSQVKVFFDLFPGRIVGITGTLGKGTCTMMTSACLTEAGIPHQVGGNIGTPVLELLRGEAPEWALLELSSFQCMDLHRGPDIAAILRTTSEHLDWHFDVTEYRDAKAGLVRHQREEALCLFQAASVGAREIAAQAAGRRIGVGTETALAGHPLHPVAGVERAAVRVDDAGLWLCGDADCGCGGADVPECKGSEDAERATVLPNAPIRMELARCKVKGVHQLENMGVAAAIALEMGADPEAVRRGLEAFAGLTYRCQWVGARGGIAFYNDSYATRPEATLAAARSLPGPLALILGGSEKYADFAEMADGLALLDGPLYCPLIGQTAERLERLLVERKINCSIYPGLAEAFGGGIDFLRDEGGAGSLLLSPACASFGLFANYKERGAKFNELVDGWLAGSGEETCAR